MCGDAALPYLVPRLTRRTLLLWAMSAPDFQEGLVADRDLGARSVDWELATPRWGVGGASSTLGLGKRLALFNKS